MVMWIFLGSVVAYFVVGYLYITIANAASKPEDQFTDSDDYGMAILFWPFIAAIMLFQVCHRFVVKFGRWLGNTIKK